MFNGLATDNPLQWVLLQLVIPRASLYNNENNVKYILTALDTQEGKVTHHN